ncbi:AAA family ATPase [Butyrivibrio sp. WCE2006]|uniref:AAA family ATPase n=1 Tax=Butyrivibrio sp. WCE2006 TaxID=1410611 RepID=UPI0005D1B87D|nr:AAA family ATPase [Butyrivibrio sp. WCE2006]
MNTKTLPIGVDSFEKLIDGDYYYIDKTGLIAELVESRYEVTLFTRPRRFGKSLNMSMLKSFFNIDQNKEKQKALFKDLKISQYQDICNAYMGQYPVVSITLKDVTGNNISEAKTQIKAVIGKEALRYKFVLDDRAVTDEDKALYRALIEISDGEFVMDDSVLRNSLMNLTHIIEKYYDQKVILLIDEYDVPLDKAHNGGYYDEMASLVRDILSAALKSNDSIKFSVLTGCLRIAKESIFTGLNNLRVQSISDVGFSEWFGFSESEVSEILDYYGIRDKNDIIREWYDGYKFGNMSVYCPWDVINYIQTLRTDKNALPELYWANTSSNDLLLNLISGADDQTKHDIESLLSGDSISKYIHTELTYREINESIDNIWSVLYMTGYLTQVVRMENGQYELKIPNREIYLLLKNNIYDFVKRENKEKSDDAYHLFDALIEGNDKEAERIFSDYLINHISIRDINVKKEMKENFYHGYLLGLLSAVTRAVVSNRESGDGFADILIKAPEKRVGVIIELKYAENEKLDQFCDEALRQIENRDYEQALYDAGMDTIISYGIACYKKRCRIKKK